MRHDPTKGDFIIQWASIGVLLVLLAILVTLRD